MVTITDRDSLKKWLEGRPREDAVFIASHVAARVFPIYWDHAFSPMGQKRDLTCVPFLRRLMISSLAAKMPSDEIRAADAAAAAAAADAATFFAADAADATFFAAAAADAAADTDADADAFAADAAAFAVAAADAATFFAADAAARATFAAAALWNSVDTDVAFLENGGGVVWPKLWFEAEPPFDRQWQRIKAELSGQESWGFWLDWYQRMLDGSPFPEEYLNLLKDITTRDEAFWGGEDDAVNGRIAEVWEEYLDRTGRGVAGQGELSSLAMGSNHYGKHLKTLELQAQTFKMYLETEIEVLRGNNAPLSAVDNQSKDDLIGVLKSVAEKVTAMIEALETEEPSTALAVVKEKTTEIAKITDELANSEINAEPAAHMVMFAAHVKMLTEAGAPGTIASAVAAAEMGRKYVAKLWPFGKKS